MVLPLGSVEEENRKSSVRVWMMMPSGVMETDETMEDEEKSGIFGLRCCCQKLQPMGIRTWVNPRCLGSASGRRLSNLKISSSFSAVAFHASDAPKASWSGKKPRMAGTRSQIRLARGCARTVCC